MPLGAEITGIYKTDNGDLFFNVQHPDDTLPAPENNAAVGAWTGVDFDNLDPRLTGVSVPASDSPEAKTVQVAAGRYQAIGRRRYVWRAASFGLAGIVSADGQSETNNLRIRISTRSLQRTDGSEGSYLQLLKIDLAQ